MRKETNKKFNCTSLNKSGNLKRQKMFEANEMKVPRKIVGKTNIDRIRSQQIRLSCGIQPINECEERTRREWGRTCNEN